MAFASSSETTLGGGWSASHLVGAVLQLFHIPGTSRTHLSGSIKRHQESTPARVPGISLYVQYVVARLSKGCRLIRAWTVHTSIYGSLKRRDGAKTCRNPPLWGLRGACNKPSWKKIGMIWIQAERFAWGAYRRPRLPSASRRIGSDSLYFCASFSLSLVSCISVTVLTFLLTLPSEICETKVERWV